MVEKDEKGITVKKSEDFSEWFTQVVVKSGLADYSAVSGCMVIRPLGMAIWDNIRAACESKLKAMGVQNAYFPLFIPESLLTKEAAHVEGFSPECAWVTHGGNTPLGERLAVRPTSEAIMYDSYAKWIRSWRDLPLKLMQWNNVVRWEFKHPTLLIRTREFLWVEGHTVFTTKEEAEQEVKDVASLWKEVCENHLALYSLYGRKTEKEKFAGAEYTESLEFFVPNGRIVQGPDVHHDGQNFAKAYNITYLDKNNELKHPYQNTWAITTRMIGVLVAIHGDDKGLVLPPIIAPNKVVIVPILYENNQLVLLEAQKLKQQLSEYNPVLDDREGYSPGWKYNEWELKGVPIRIEIGPKDLQAQQAVLVRRDTGEKKAISLSAITTAVKEVLALMQEDLYLKTKKMTKNNICEVTCMDELIQTIKEKKVARGPFCNNPDCEDYIKDKTEGACTCGIVLGAVPKGKCIQCGNPAKVIVHIAKSY